ncbi:hypothetical protein [Kineococcus gypseus]|uniref:hypothetical protein n=1 Tax=Kineococcus gypseus TaxID=1637102 RepID=UPI003D7D4615
MAGAGGPAGEDPLPPEEARVRELLRAAAGTAGPMPADVVERVDRALAAARAQDAAGRAPAGVHVADLDAARRARAARRTARWQRGLLAAAAAAVVVAGVANVTGGSGALEAGSGSSAADSAAVPAAGGAGAAGAAGAAESTQEAAAPAPPPPAPPPPAVLSSGADYADEAAVRTAGVQLLSAPAPGQGPVGPGPAGTADGGPGTGSAGRPAPEALPGVPGADAEHDRKLAPAAPGAADESQRPAAERALECARALGVDATSVAVVQVAAWRSQPAALVVERTAAGGEVVVVALGCTPGEPALARTELPVPAPPAGS